MKKYNWQIAQLAPIENNSSISPILQQLLYNRNIVELEQMEAFLNKELVKANWQLTKTSFLNYDPFLFTDMKAALELIISHIKKGSKILVYGDYDVDGVTASALLINVLKSLKAQVDVYLPDRVSEGYGLNNEAILKHKEEGFALIITVDNGIRNYQEVKYAQSLGLDIVITDHHVLPDNPEEIPQCLVIDPADKNSNYPCSFLAGVGVAFKLAQALLSQSTLSDELKEEIIEKNLDLLTLGTVADLVPLISENRLFTQHGLNILNLKQRPGLKAIYKTISLKGDTLDSSHIAWQIAPRLNAASRIAHANSAYQLLTTQDPVEAMNLALELNERNTLRQSITKEIIKQVENNIDPDKLPNIIIGLAKDDEIWNEGVIGLVAGKIAEKYYRPTLIISRLTQEAQLDREDNSLKATKTFFKASGRSVEGYNLIATIETLSPYLDKYGGHPMACGFSINSQENLDKFIAGINNLAEKIDPSILVPILKLDASLDLDKIDEQLIEELEKLAPYGQSNQPAKFASLKVRLEDYSFVGSDNSHVKLTFSQNNKYLEAIFFRGAQCCQDLVLQDLYDIAYFLKMNHFNGQSKPQLRLIDIKTSL